MSTRVTAIGMLSVILLFGVSCDQGTPPAETASVTDSAGITIVRVAATAWAAPIPVEHERTLDPGPNHPLYQLESAAFGPGGSYFVANSSSGTILHFSRDGEFLGAFGGKGDGPGEFRRLNQLLELDDGVAAVDWRMQTITEFGVDGALRREWAPGPRSEVLGATNGGWFASSGSPLFSLPDLGGFKLIQSNLIKITPDGEETILAALPVDSLFHTEGGQFDRRLFASPARFGTTDSAVVVAATTDYVLNVFSSDGRLVRSLRGAHRGRPGVLEDVDAAHARVANFMHGVGRMPREAQDQQVRTINASLTTRASQGLSTTPLVIGELLVSRSGTIWIERIDGVEPSQLLFEFTLLHLRQARMGPIDQFDRIRTWDIWTVDGSFIGQTTTPSGFEPKAVSGTRVLGVQRDSLDVESVFVLSANLSVAR